jgi:putative ABC transport system substrate-binding protein
VRRRTIVLGAAASAVLAATGARAQQPGRMYRVGVLTSVAGLAGAPYLSALREQLGKHGFVDGRNLGIDVRVPDSFGSQAAAAAARELIARKPDAILSMGTTLTQGALASTGTIPVVFTWVSDPLGSGLLKDLAKPDRNATGATNRNFELTAKRIELVRALLPVAKRLAMATNYFDPVLEQAMSHAQRAAEQVGIELVRVEVGGSWANGVESSRKAGAQAMLALTPFRFFGLRFAEEDVVRQSIEQRYPVTFSNVETVNVGGLASYATRLTDDIRRAADLLARVLVGVKPQELSVDQAARFELAINLKTARAIGVPIPQSLLLRADRVIE